MLNYETYIEPNPDTYAGGFRWSVCLDGEELDCGLAFTFESAEREALASLLNLKG